jgi:cardiolipin synthase
VLLDYVGCRKIGDDAERTMKDAGVRVVRYREHGFHTIGVFNERDHRKLLVADGRVALVGGHCIVDHWLGDAQDGDHYADVSVRVRGPIVNSVQAAFSENWIGETGELIVGPDIFPPAERAGDVTMYAAYVKPEGSPPAVKLFHHTVLCLARKRLWIQNPYFIAEPEAIEAFGKAVERGVDVRVLMPATSGSDNPMVQHAGHRNFERLLKLGVRLFEYPDTLLHQKVMTVDGVWCAVGSANFDDRSFEINDEFVLGIADAETTRRLDAIFEKYASRASEIRLAEWQKRGVWHKAKDQFFYLANELL